MEGVRRLTIGHRCRLPDLSSMICFRTHTHARRTQDTIRERIQYSNDPDFDIDSVKFVGGTDISFVKGSDDALACLSVLNFPSLELVGSVMQTIRMEEPYISGFLAFREQPPLQSLLDRLRREKKLPEPDVWLVDGNGALHPRRCGLACHFGVVAGVRTIGVGKSFLHVDGITKDGVACAISKHLLGSEQPACAAAAGEAKEDGPSSAKEGEPVPKEPSDVSKDCLVVRSAVDEQPLCAALLSGKSGSKRPIFVSVGHRVSLHTATELVRRCCKHRMPEPIRAADLGSREVLRSMAKEEESWAGEGEGGSRGAVEDEADGGAAVSASISLDESGHT